MKIISWLKKYFIPHEGNDHKPHILRREAALFIAVFLVGLEAIFLLQVFFIFPQSNLFALILPNVLVDETNANRTTNDLPALAVSPLLTAAAQEKADDMAAKGYFAHVSPDGKTPWYWFAQVGYEFSYAGENLAVNFTDSAAVTQAWMNSPDHRANILDNHFTQIGIATAQGNFDGHTAVYVVELFGTPAIAAAPAPASVASAPAPGVVPTTAPMLAKPPVVIQQTATATPNGNDIFVAVKGAETQAVAASSVPAVPASVPAPAAATPPAPAANPVQTALASPHTTFDYVLYALGGLILVAFILNLAVKARIQHPSIVLNGALLILIVTFIFLFNNYITIAPIHIL